MGVDYLVVVLGAVVLATHALSGVSADQSTCIYLCGRNLGCDGDMSLCGAAECNPQNLQGQCKGCMDSPMCTICYNQTCLTETATAEEMTTTKEMTSTEATTEGTSSKAITVSQEFELAKHTGTYVLPNFYN